MCIRDRKKDFDMVADDVLKEPVLGFNPCQNITKEDILSILENAFSGGTSVRRAKKTRIHIAIVCIYFI